MGSLGRAGGGLELRDNRSMIRSWRKEELAGSGAGELAGFLSLLANWLAFLIA